MISLALKCHTPGYKRESERTWEQQPAGKEEMMAQAIHKTHKATAQALQDPTHTHFLQGDLIT